MVDFQQNSRQCIQLTIIQGPWTRIPPTVRTRGGCFLGRCLCRDTEVTLISEDSISPAQSDDELRQRAYKRIIEICEDSMNRNDVHMMIQCNTCSKCRTCKDIRKINASSYNDFREQQAMEQLIRFVEGENGEPGYFISPLPLKPFNTNSVKGNKLRQMNRIGKWS